MRVQRIILLLCLSVQTLPFPDSCCRHGFGSLAAGEQVNTRTTAYRQNDDRPSLNYDRLADHGIRVYESHNLRLLSDLPAEQVEALPGLADNLFRELEKRLGKLKPAPDGADFQVTGCLMDAEERFRRAGLLPEIEFSIRHGRHLNYRFWMRNQTTDYYRRHLLLHEFTHCFMSCEYGMRDIPSLWYTEGIAEYFGTHTLPERPGAPPNFGVLPQSVDLFPGWGRISEIRRSFNEAPSRDVADAGFTTLKTVIDPPTGVLIEDSQYAHAWALFWMLQTHPRYHDVFAELLPLRSGRHFAAKFSEISPEVHRRLAIDWLLLLDSITEGFDVARSFPVRNASEDSIPESPENTTTSSGNKAISPLSISIAAASGWQDSGCRPDAGQTIQLQAGGRFQVDDQPRPWISEPQGVTLKYHRGRPLGELILMLVATDGSRASRRIPVGTSATVQVPYAAEVWLQLNDSAADRADNAGNVDVSLTIVQSDSEDTSP